MAHYAKLDNDNNVLAVHVVNNSVIDSQNEEQSGADYLNNLYGINAVWRQTSYNGKIRKQYAGVGYSYDPVADVFITPQPYASWSLDQNYDWQPPTPRPEGKWSWDEDTLSWIEIES